MIKTVPSFMFLDSTIISEEFTLAYADRPLFRYLQNRYANIVYSHYLTILLENDH